MFSRILVVEDDDSIRKVLVELLKHEGFKVDSVDNGRDAITYLTKINREPCIVLLDLMMPSLTGWQVIEMLQKGDRVATIPIVAMTAHNLEKTLPGTVGCIKKPFSLEQLLETVRDFCSSSAA